MTFTHFMDREDTDALDRSHAPASAPLAAAALPPAMTQHPRTPGTLWDAIGWNAQRNKNIDRDAEIGAWRREWRRPDSGKAA